MTTVSVAEAQDHLAELIAGLHPEQPVLITQDSKPVAYLVPALPPAQNPVFGSCRGLLTVVSDDDEHLADFADYMQ